MSFTDNKTINHLQETFELEPIKVNIDLNTSIIFIFYDTKSVHFYLHRKIPNVEILKKNTPTPTKVKQVNNTEFKELLKLKLKVDRTLKHERGSM